MPFLARLAAEAGEMTGIAGVLLTTLHNPVEVAEAIASVDAIWRGNFVFGVGLGYRDVEFDAFGVPRGHRVRRFEQCLEVVKRLWTEDNVSFENEVCKLSNVTMTCRPVQQPHPPIWFAANNDRAVQRAARLGDSWFNWRAHPWRRLNPTPGTAPEPWVWRPFGNNGISIGNKRVYIPT